MDELNDILLDNETVFWTERPDWEKAERPKAGWRAKSGAIKFALIMLFSFAAMMAWGMIFDPQGFAGGTLGVLIALSFISLAIAAFNIVDSSDDIYVRHDHIYAITNRRILIRNNSKLTTRSLTGSVVYEINTERNGSVFDITVAYNYPGDGYATFHALADPKIPEKLLLNHFALRKAETQ